MKISFLLTVCILITSATLAQMATGQYTYFNGDWQIKFEVVDNGQKVSSIELTDLHTNKTLSGSGAWRKISSGPNSENSQRSVQGTEASFYEIQMADNAYRFDTPRGGALMFEFSDGKKVWMKERK